MKRRLWKLGLVLGILTQAPIAQGNPRLIMHTIAGDILVELQPELAPIHTQQILKLVLNGVYDGVHFHRAEPGFVLQLANAGDRLIPLNPIQKGLIANIPLELTSVKHTRGVLSMARWENDPSSAQTSFSILLGDAPHLDGKYTIFGKVLRGMEVVEAMVDVPRGSHGGPAMRLGVSYTELVNPSLSLDQIELIPAVPIGTGVRALARESGFGEAAKGLFPITVGLLFVLVILGIALPPSYSSKPLWWAAAAVCGFPWLALALSYHHRSSWIGLAIFVLLIGFFKGMAGFEFARLKTPRSKD